MEREVVILAGARTPFGKFCGSLKEYTATDLAVFASKEALARSGVDPLQIQHVIFGNAEQTSADSIYLARHVALRSGLPSEVPALTVNRICGSGFQAIVSGAQMLLLDEADHLLVGGTESMSQAPHVIRGGRWGIPLGQSKLEDSLWEALYDPFCGYSMALTAENLASKYGVTREEADQFAYESQMKTKEAMKKGKLEEEIVPVPLKDGARGGGKGKGGSPSAPHSGTASNPSTAVRPGTGTATALKEKVREGEAVPAIDADEHPRPGTTLDALASLKPYFKEGGIVTAGNASGISDGAAAMVITTSDRIKGQKPLGKLLSWGIAGCPPEIMGIGPAPASRLALKKAALTVDQMDLIEVNEAFAPQYLAVEKELGLDREKVNVNGGAIALGHPLGATGARLTLTLLYELKRRKKRYGLATACIGGGQGIALVLEAIH